MSILTKIIEIFTETQDLSLVLRDVAIALKNKGFFNNSNWSDELIRHFKDVVEAKVDENISFITDNEHSISTTCLTGENVTPESPQTELLDEMTSTPNNRRKPDLPTYRPSQKSQELPKPKGMRLLIPKLLANNDQSAMDSLNTVDGEIGRQLRPVRYSPEPVDVGVMVSSDRNENVATYTDESMSQSSDVIPSRSRKRKASEAESNDSAAKSSKMSRRPSMRNRSYRVIFSMIDPEKHTSDTLKEMHISIAETGIYDVLITDKIYRSLKFMCALAAGKPIVSIEWLNALKAKKSTVDPYEFLLKDLVGEKKYGFNLYETLDAVQKNGGLCQNVSILVTPNTTPTPDILKDIIVSSGGKYLKTSLVARKNDRVLCISDEKDKKIVTQMKKKYPDLQEITVEQFMQGIFQYKI